jgi:hypothetical protein
MLEAAKDEGFRYDDARRPLNEAAVRYVRWSAFDSGRGATVTLCWLDRRTGRLAFQPPHIDPNVVGLAATDPEAQSGEIALIGRS